MIASSVPSGTVTFLFTDIEGSTQRWEHHPRAMRQVLARHDALLNEGITAYGGVVVTERGEGDSFFALFARPSDALAAACTLQRALAAEAWPEEVAPIRVRMALHTGEAGLWEGQDYRGAAVNRCARLRAVAHGGQVLLSAATYELVRDLLPPEVTLRDLGEHRLKDLTCPEHIFQLLHADLPAEFPPLRTLDRQRHNLPVQPTALIGREREIRAVRERLLEPEARLLTLTGVGGTGKTRLALQVAAEVLDVFPAGVFFINLAPISDPDLVLPTIAQALEVREAGGQPLREVLHAFLQDKRLLLLLDNFEQVLDAAPVVSDLLAAAAQVRVLATSRAALHLRGERLYAVPPLTLPELTPPPPLEALTQYEAVRLFIARAQDVKPDFAVTHETAQAVAEICVRLDGLPLALELAAARIRLLAPQALLTRLSSRLKVLTGGARDLPARQQTLRATIDWSYSLLTEAEQTLFARLGAFVGGCTLEAIEAVCNPEGEVDVLAGVASLLDKSLSLRTDEDGEARFGMLETIHEYARERLEARGEMAALRRQHAVYYLALAERVEPELVGMAPAAWLARLEVEYDNLRAALQWVRERGEIELGLRAAGALSRFWWIRGHLSEGRRWLEELLAVAQCEGCYGSLRTKAMRGAGMLAAEQGDFERATALFEESLALSRTVGDKREISFSLAGLGNTAYQQGDFRRATVLYGESLTLFRDLEDPGEIASTLSQLGIVARQCGDLERAAALLEESVRLFRTLSDEGRIAVPLTHLAIVARHQGDQERAAVLHEESLTLFRDLGNPGGIAISLQNLGELARYHSDYGRATVLYAESLALFRTLGDKVGIAYCMEGLAAAAYAHRQPEPAARLCGAAAALREAIGAPLAPVDRPSYDHTVAAAREALGEDAFAAAWAVGQALPLEQAVAEALTYSVLQRA